MSIGFLGANSSQKTVDLYNGNAGTLIDVSLQNVLSKYDTVRTDFDRLVDSARQGTFELTSRANYNAYLKDAQNGWAENWYSEYKAVLALRADALQKKLQAAYNRVLERSVYTDMAPDDQSVFAPYANRTFSGADVNYRMPVSQVLLKDGAVTALPTAPPTPTPNLGTNSIDDIVNGIPDNILGVREANISAGGSYGSGDSDMITYQRQSTKLAVTDAASTYSITDPKMLQQLALAGTDAANRILGANGMNPDNVKPYASQDFSGITPPPTPSPAPSSPTPTPPIPPPYGDGPFTYASDGTKYPDYYYLKNPSSGLFASGYGDTTYGIKPQYIDRSSTGNWSSSDGLYAGVRQTVDSLAKTLLDPLAIPTGPGGIGGGPSVSTAVAPIPPSTSDYYTSYSTDNNAGNPKIVIPMFGGGDTVIDFSKILPKDVYDTLLSSPAAVGSLNEAIAQINQGFLGRQYDDIVQANQYDANYVNVSLMVYPGPLEIYTLIDSVSIASLGGSYVQAGASGLIGTVGGGLFSLGIGPDIHYGHYSAISGATPVGFPPFPSIGIAGTLLTIPIPYVPITIGVNVSYDLVTQIIKDFLDRTQRMIVEALQVQSYAASSGTAFDSYASRGEYSMSEPGFSTAADQFQLSLPFGLEVPFGGIFDKLMFDGLFGASSAGLAAPSEIHDQVDNADIKQRLFDYKHSIQGAESRETETGAFFATNSFLSQFELNNMSSEYWVGTQQNEEVVNADLARAITTGGKEFLKLIAQTIVAAAGSATKNTTAGLAMSTILGAAADANIAQTMYNLMYKDLNTTGQINNGIPIIKSDFNSEAYDYIENDHKPFEADSDFNYVPNKGPLSFLSYIFSQGTPDFILDGYANTKRFTATPDDKNLTLADWTSMTDSLSADGFGPRGWAGTTGGSAGFWTDTPVGDINEVYVGTRKVTFGNLTEGFNAFSPSEIAGSGLGAGEKAFVTDTGAAGASFLQSDNLNSTRSVESALERFVGSDSRVFGRRYDPSDPVNQETFNSGLYTGNKQHYDRRNQYSLSFNTQAEASVGNSAGFNLFGSQALNPTLGGFIKMAEIDKNKEDTTLLEYEDIDTTTKLAKSTGQKNLVSNITGLRGQDQQFGAAADGNLNELNQVLYDHMHLRSDGRNLSTIQDYRDVFNTGTLMKNIFISGQAYHPSGGGITSSIEIRYDPTQGTSNVQSDTRENFSNSYDPYYTLFSNKTKGKATVYLNTYFAYKKRAANKKT